MHRRPTSGSPLPRNRLVLGPGRQLAASLGRHRGWAHRGASSTRAPGGVSMSQLRTNGRRVLEAHLQNTSIRAISGSMVAYDGQVQFKSAGLGGGEGLVAGLKRKATGE